MRLRDHRAIEAALPQTPTEVRELDVSILHALVFDRIFGVKPEAIKKGGNLEYTIDAAGALDAVSNGNADGAFLMNPPSIEDVQRVSDSGATMPEKSTYFYPKLITGLFMNPLDVDCMRRPRDLTLVLVRHGETEGESSIRYHGRNDVKLSKLGRAQMLSTRREIEARFGEIKFYHVFTTPLSRAFESARLIVDDDAAIVTIEEFIEVHFGLFEGLTADEIRERHPVEFEKWNVDRLASTYAYPEGESRAAFADRVERGLGKTIKVLDASDRFRSDTRADRRASRRNSRDRSISHRRGADRRVGIDSDSRSRIAMAYARA